MPRINPDVLRWARENAGLSLAEAAQKIPIKQARGIEPSQRLQLLETGEVDPTRSLLSKIAQTYHQPLLTFYMSAPPRKSDRGKDFRSLPEEHSAIEEPLLDTLLRDMIARQGLVRTVLEEDEDAAPLSFIGSITEAHGIASAVAAVKDELGFDLEAFRSARTIDAAFQLFRDLVEAKGVFVVLAGDLGSRHTSISLETMRGVALSDPFAPFIVVNDQDAHAAWSFTVAHEFVHLLLGETGVSGVDSTSQTERFCNEVAGELLLPTSELKRTAILTDPLQADSEVSAIARSSNVSHSMVAYRLHQAGQVDQPLWAELAQLYRARWLSDKEARRAINRQKDGGPSYYTVRRHRVGKALLSTASRLLSSRDLTTSKAAQILGVKPRNVGGMITGRVEISSVRSA